RRRRPLHRRGLRRLTVARAVWTELPLPAADASTGLGVARGLAAGRRRGERFTVSAALGGPAAPARVAAGPGRDDVSDEGRAVLLKLDGVVNHYRRAAEDVVALDGVDLTVDESEAVALVGPSGSGKST